MLKDGEFLKKNLCST